MAITKTKLKQLENSATVGSITATDTSNILSYVAPLSQNHLWGYEHGTTATLPIIIGTNLSYDAGTNTLNASAGAGGYSDVQEEGAGFTNSNTNTKLNFVGSGLTATDGGSGVTNVTVNSFLNTLATAGTVGLASGNISGTLAVGNGGTGATSLTGLLRGNGTSAFTAITTSSTVGQVLRVTAADTYAWGALDLADTDAVIGVLDEVNGGTGQSTITTGDILYGSASNTLSKLPIGGASTYLKGGTTPSWGTLNIAALSDGGTIATQTYVNNLIAGIRKGSVRVATTVNGTLATAYANAQVVDTVTLVTGDLILLKNQTATADNGVYTVNASGAPTRATWMDSATEIDGVYVAVEDGSQAGTLWITVSEVAALGTDPIVFTQIQTSGTVLGSAGATNTLAFWSATNTIDDAALSYTNGSVFALGTVTNAANTILTTKGTDSLNTSFGILHQNSAATQVFRVSNTGEVLVGSGAPTILNSTGLGNTGTLFLYGGTSAGVRLYGGAATTGAYSLSVESGVTRTHTTGHYAGQQVISAFAPTSGTGTYTALWVNDSITQTGGANGITRGIFVQPSLTTPFDYRGIEVTANASHYALWTTSGKVRHDLGSDATGDTWYRGATGEMTKLAAGATSGHVLTSNGSGAAPSWQAAVSATVTTVGYVTGSGTATYDLDSGSVVLDVDGSAFAFTVPANLDLVDVYRNGIMLSRSGTVGRDYTLNSGTGVLVLASVLASDETLKIVKRV